MVTRVYKHRRGKLYIEEWMEKRGLNDAAVASRIDPPVARETVTRWRGAQRSLTADKIARLAAALNLEPEELWSPPDDPAVAMLLDVPDELRQSVAASVNIFRKTGS